jgi:hypothetical protein
LALHWPLPDPAGRDEPEEAGVARFRAIRDELRGRIAEWLIAEGIVASDEVPP